MRITRLIAPFLIATIISGCASTRVQLATQPGDSSIYVDGELVGKGEASLDVGPEYNYPKTYTLRIKRDSYKTLETRISNQPDYAQAGMSAALVAALSILNLTVGMSDPDKYRSNLVSGLISLLVIPVPFFTSNKFQKRYEFELEPQK